ncbi:DNA helicase UvrD-like C-terminal [Penicillium canariense]|uniref:DNA helicase UvrD-like C-terminal n=1 Tax=Penicillium canariense TaxID=189055 RepID=A0A9W9I437_9EURO|nr:DNA helicase UvrD-like C-terminal [Penicillium canariense]KAJ5166413.1 DNA helicase UvrD-like C-terminal [Penicillium canariense]
MGSSRRPTLCTILLQVSDPGLHEYNHALARIDQYYTGLFDGMTDEAVREEIELHPARTLTRLQKSFDILKTKSLAAPVAEGIFKSVIVSLVNSSANLLSPDQAVQLVGSALPLVIKHPTPYLREVAELLVSQDGMFEHLVADEKHVFVMKEWLLSKKKSLDLSVTIKMSEKLVNMCDACSSGHGVGCISKEWKKATNLMASLQDLLNTLNSNNNCVLKENLPSLDTMKVLDRDDKKSNQAKNTRSERKVSFNVPEAVQEDLQSLEMPKVHSTSAVIHALGHLRTEIVPKLMRTALESFPCRICLEKLDKSSTHISNPVSEELYNERQEGVAVDLFGKPVGLWKVLLSDEAMKSVKKLARAGDVSRVGLRLREIASGKWHGADLDKPAGSKEQRKRMRIPIMRAKVSTSTWILWQIDVGFYDDAPWVEQQIAKVWQIATSEDEMEVVIGQIIEIQGCYHEETVEKCCNIPPKQTDDTFIPNRYGHAKKNASKMKPIGATRKADHALLDMSNKSYNVTESLLKSIMHPTGREEFPFELSPEEMEIVRHFDTSSLILGRSGTGKTTCLLFKIFAKYRARQAAHGGKSIRQILLTRSPHLASKLQAYSRSLIETQNDDPSRESSSTDQEPDSFLSLKDQNFPFVCTYDEFLGLLEKTFRRANRQDFLGNKHAKRNGEAILDKKLEERIIDFDGFKTEYWSCLSGIAPSGCSPELLFAEIMGVVKGSSISARTLVPLTHVEYLSRGSKASPAFATETDRDKVFQTFERYEKIKRQRKQLDELDRVIALLQALKESPNLSKVIRQCFEEIYVDEIQDLRCLDIVLLLSCLCDARGIHLAGDTAQCISKDSVFRFPEIKALFYDYYEAIATELNQPSIAKPKQFMLAKNYRSHQGILSFASWVMHLLWNGFPETIDKLDPEIGLTGGPKPIIFAGFDSSILSAKMIGLVKLNDQVADFGAEQVILVRDETSKNKLQSQIGEIALVLTILESKGMEFDDVLVYNFFGGHLYVAATRARKQLWFMETIDNSIDPILQALSTSGDGELAELVRQKDEDVGLVSMLVSKKAKKAKKILTYTQKVAEKVQVLRAGGSVDPERWIKRAAHLLHQKNYADALFCYKKANDTRGIAQSQAWLHEQEGRSRRAAGDSEGFSVSYEKAIALFLETELLSEAADCFQGLGRFDKAAELWKNQGQLQKAAAFYERGGHYSEASECFHLNGESEQAIEVLRRGEQFDELIDYINRNRSRLSSTTLHRYSRLCNILLKQGRISSDLRAATIRLLGSDVDKLAFFKEFEMYDQLRSFYNEKGRWYEYYETSVAAGDLPAAMDTMLCHKLMHVLDKKTVETILHYSMVEVLFAHFGIIEGRPELEQDFLKPLRSTPLENPTVQWLTIFELADSLQNQLAPATMKTLHDGILKDFFCLFVVSHKIETVLRKWNVINLPFDILMHATKLLYDLESRDKDSLASLSLLCGLYNPPKQDDVLVMLPWSTIKPESGADTVDLSTEGLLSRAKAWIRERFSEAIAHYEFAASTIFKHEFPRRCPFFIIRGVCAKQRQGECDLFHERAGSDTCMARLQSILSIAEVYSRLSNLYYSRVMTESFHKTFLGRRRHWVQMLMSELSFVTSLEQSTTTIAKLLSKLRNGTEFGATRACFEDLLYHRMGRDWHGIQTFTALLEQVHISRLLGKALSINMNIESIQAQFFSSSLGPECAWRYFRALVSRINGILYRHRHSTHPLKISLDGLYSAVRLRLAIIEQQPVDFICRVKEFCLCMDMIDRTSLEHLHSLYSVLELASTQMLCIVNPASACVIPWSWVLQYLPLIMKAPVARENTPDEVLRATYMACVRGMVTSICKLAQTVESAALEHAIEFQGLGRKRITPSMAKRRLFDLLTTIVLNLAHHPIRPRGLNEIWDLVHKTLGYVAPPGFSTPGSLQKLRDVVLPTYAAYNGKDKLHVITLDDSDKCPPYLRAFVTQADPRLKLSFVLGMAQFEENEPVTKLANDTFDMDDYSRYEIEIVVKLQSRWRRVKLVLEDNRRMEESLEGQLMHALFSLCSTKFGTLPGSARVPAKEKIRIRKLLFTDGMNIMLDLEALIANLRLVNQQWKIRFDLSFLQTSDIEELDNIKSRMTSIEAKLKELTQFWSLHGLNSVVILVSSKVLSEKAREAHRIILVLKHDLEAIEAEVERISRG